MQTTQERKAAFEGWVILELMGHRRLAGYLREETVAGAAFVRIDVPGDKGAIATQFYSPSAVYCITPTTTNVRAGRRSWPRKYATAGRPRTRKTMRNHAESHCERGFTDGRNIGGQRTAARPSARDSGTPSDRRENPDEEGHGLEAEGEAEAWAGAAAEGLARGLRVRGPASGGSSGDARLRDEAARRRDGQAPHGPEDQRAGAPEGAPLVRAGDRAPHPAGAAQEGGEDGARRDGASGGAAEPEVG